MMNFYEYSNTRLDLDEYREYIELLGRDNYVMIDWSKVEHIIRRSPRSAYRHALSYKRGRWLEAESCIIKSPPYAYKYARHIIKDRWVEAEPCIMSDVRAVCLYAAYVMKDRWIEAEPAIKAYPYWWRSYKQEFGI